METNKVININNSKGGNEMANQKIIKVDAEVVSDIETKDSKYQALSAVLQNLIETHLINNDVTFMDSPVVLKLQDQITTAKKAWEDAKNAMALKYIPKADIKHTKNWTLDYGTNELILDMVK